MSPIWTSPRPARLQGPQRAWPALPASHTEPPLPWRQAAQVDARVGAPSLRPHQLRTQPRRLARAGRLRVGPPFLPIRHRGRRPLRSLPTHRAAHFLDPLLCHYFALCRRLRVVSATRSIPATTAARTIDGMLSPDRAAMPSIRSPRAAGRLRLTRQPNCPPLGRPGFRPAPSPGRCSPTAVFEPTSCMSPSHSRFWSQALVSRHLQ